jgi:hypothetical protein
MKDTIHILKDPVRVKDTEWLFTHRGRMSAAKETGEDGIVDILAYSDNSEDFDRIEDIADISGGCIIRNISELEVDCIDDLVY